MCPRDAALLTVTRLAGAAGIGGDTLPADDFARALRSRRRKSGVSDLRGPGTASFGRFCRR
jgi:hypothetical protein